MIPLALGDLFATKAAEYVLVLCFLATLVVFWWVLNRPGRAAAAPARTRPSGAWFETPDNVFFHPGHGWVIPQKDGVFRVGIDDFSQKLLGTPSVLRLPEIGSRVRQGENAWQVEVDSIPVDFLSPADGEVVAHNARALADPELIDRDPYGEGWLLKIRPERPRADLRGLLNGDVARNWMATIEASLRRRVSRELGAVLQDGGVPVRGIAKSIAPDRWRDVAREYLLSG